MGHFIEVKNLHRIYQTGDTAVHALDGVSFTVGQGEFISIIGSSGSGKSTLMNILGCLDTPTSGEYRLNGVCVGALDDKALSAIRNREIGFIFQSFNLIPTLNALENVELQLLYREVERRRRRELACQALEQVGLSDRMHHTPGQMSGGQQQRVAIARAIASCPPLILADEPTGNLDSASAQEIMRILQTLNRDGRTVILITHDNQIAAQAHRTLRIADGKLMQA